MNVEKTIKKNELLKIKKNKNVGERKRAESDTRQHLKKKMFERIKIKTKRDERERERAGNIITVD